ncbi:MAG: hypothetical protein HZA90_11965 [Verrucomicrobia bacterium]|nr:hypothetical protein [Verrucomicrobiota bacterium]
MKAALAAVQIYSPAQRQAEKARQRQRDGARAAAGQAEAVQAQNRLVTNPKEWRLEVPEEVPTE